MISFEEEIRQVINRHSAEAPSGTPDYILAKFLTETLKTFNEAVGMRAEHRGETIDLKVVERKNKIRQRCYICNGYVDDGWHDTNQYRLGHM